MEWWLALLIFLAGVLARVFVPWLIVRYKRPDDPDSKWTWRYIFPQLIAVVVLFCKVFIVAQKNTRPPSGRRKTCVKIRKTQTKT